MDNISDMNFNNVNKYYKQGLQEIMEGDEYPNSLPNKVIAFENELNSKSSLQKYYIGPSSQPPETESLDNNTILVWFQLSDN